MNKLTQTPSQTVGPYFAYGLTAHQYAYPHTQIADGDLILDETLEGERIEISGCVLDGEGKTIPDAMIEIWQADAHGKYDNKKFTGFGRQGTGTKADGSFRFKTIKPGRVEGQAPHITVVVFMRGLLTHAYTRLYFEDEAKANEADELLKQVPADRKQTLIAKKAGTDIYRFNIYMQGDHETVFFDV